MSPCHTSIGVVVLTLNAANHLTSCLPPLLASSLKPRILVVDSSSDDTTVADAERFGVETLVIPRASFNHGATRELARRHLNTSIVVMVTQDAYAVDGEALNLLVAPLLNGNAAVSYGRQLPHAGANIYETFHRFFNYPEESQRRSFKDIRQYGKQLFFCSNSFAAYRNEALDAIGGFRPQLFGEDTIAVAELLPQGHSIAYVAEAAVYHSHAYTLSQELRRHFDIGYARRANSTLLETADSDYVRGRAYVKALFKHLFHRAPQCLPFASLLVAAKWCGYKLGWHGHHLPLWLRRTLSAHKGYWT